MSFEDFDGGYGSTRSSSMTGGSKSTSTWDRVYATTQQQVQEISTNVPYIQRSASRIGTNFDTPELRTQIKDRVAQTRNIIRSVMDNLKNLQAIENGEVDGNQKRRVSQKLGKDFQTLLEEFRRACKTWVDKDRLHPLPKTANSAPTDNIGQQFYYQGPPDARDDQASLLQPSREQLQAVGNQMEFREFLIKEREKEISEVEQAVIEVNDMFRDFGMLVKEQGTWIDNIESHIDEAVTNVDSGVSHLKKAEEYQSKANSKLWIIVACIGIFLAIVVTMAALGITIGVAVGN